MIEDIGFTGTREGMTWDQRDELMNILRRAQEKTATRLRFHHGDCLGADFEAGEIAAALEYWIVIHPPKNEKLRGFGRHNEARKPKEYQHRNRDIVSESGLVLVAPKEHVMVPKGTRGSGTWSTYYRAVDTHTQTFIIWPDGRTLYQENK